MYQLTGIEAVPWYADPVVVGWIGTVAQILSLLALIFAGYELVQRSRRVDPVEWLVDVQGSVDVDGVGTVHVARFTNFGRGHAIVNGLAFVRSNGVDSSSDDLGIPPVVLPSGWFFIGFSTEKLDDAWVVIDWSNTEDMTKRWVAWFPLGDEGELEKRRQESMNLSLREADQARRAVGPGGLAKVGLQAGPLPSEVWRIVEEDGGDDVWWMWASYQKPADIPRVWKRQHVPPQDDGRPE